MNRLSSSVFIKPSLDKILHIVAHEVPWPANYGGVFDLFFKIKALHEAGVQIHLHCFRKNNEEADFLNRFCSTVHYYDRKPYTLNWPLRPYIVQCRRDRTLLARLNADNHPILFEGIHTTWALHGLKNKNRPLHVRLHNVESRYYRMLYKHQSFGLRKLYYWLESRLLHHWEKSMPDGLQYWAVSPEDVNRFKEINSPSSIFFLPVFLPWNEVKSTSELGHFCLYHGNLSVNENAAVARWLLEKVFNDINVPLVIAGKDPSHELIALAHLRQHTCLVENPSDYELEDLIQKAQINVLPDFNDTGVKLKVMHALYTGKHVLVNQQAAAGTGLSWNIQFPETASAWKESIVELFRNPFSEKRIADRKKMLDEIYRTDGNVQTLINALWSHDQ
jgi:hypothetical protein